MANILAIGAHADDIEIGCASTLNKHIREGDTITYVCLTSGPSIDGVTGQILRSSGESNMEIINACTLLGISDVIIFDNQDLCLEFSLKTVSELEKVISSHDVDTMYIHYHGDANQDHIAANRICMAAGRYVNRVLCYEQIPLPRLYTKPFTGEVYITYDTFDLKAKAIAAHVSQVNKYIEVGYDIIEDVQLRDRANSLNLSGLSHRGYAERFDIIKYVM